jgi:hypothetical protein
MLGIPMLAVLRLKPQWAARPDKIELLPGVEYSSVVERWNAYEKAVPQIEQKLVLSGSAEWAESKTDMQRGLLMAKEWCQMAVESCGVLQPRTRVVESLSEGSDQDIVLEDLSGDEYHQALASINSVTTDLHDVLDLVPESGAIMPQPRERTFDPNDLGNINFMQHSSPAQFDDIGLDSMRPEDLEDMDFMHRLPTDAFFSMNMTPMAAYQVSDGDHISPHLI